LFLYSTPQTFLFVHPDHGPEGLQIKSVAGGEVGGGAGGEQDGWRDVVLPTTKEPVLIVNTGALLARWTNDEWKATAHRVVVADAAAAARSRYSIACFIDPDSDALVEVHPRYGADIRYKPIKSMDYLLMKLESMMKEEPKRV
jgi:isopenicillin N synthase-like dioxygenase